MSKFHEKGRAKAAAKQQETKKSSTGPKEPPAQMQLPGGVVIKGYAFRITSCDAQGRPTSFELARGNENSDCVLWASPTFIDQRLPDHLDQRWRRRVEESIEGPGSYDTDQRTYTKERSLGPSVLHVDPSTSDALKKRLLAGDLSSGVTVVGRTPDGQVELRVDDPTVIEALKRGARPVSLGSEYPDPEKNSGDDT